MDIPTAGKFLWITLWENLGQTARDGMVESVAPSSTDVHNAPRFP
jgi:hypothetical protein